MNENLKKVLDQFACEGLQGDWSVICAVAYLELSKLERDQKKLAALEGAGVDNWEWYGDAMASIE